MASGAARRAQRWFWGLAVTAVLGLGLLVRELGSPPSPLTGLVTFLSGLVVLAASVQAARILVRLAAPTGAHRRADPGSPPPEAGTRVQPAREQVDSRREDQIAN